MQRIKASITVPLLTERGQGGSQDKIRGRLGNTDWMWSAIRRCFQIGYVTEESGKGESVRHPGRWWVVGLCGAADCRMGHFVSLLSVEITQTIPIMSEFGCDDWLI